jgi:hypothetical protein
VTPLAHVTNAFVDRIDGDSTDVRAKAIGIYSGGRTFSGDYLDTLVRTDAGWRPVNRPVVADKAQASAASSPGRGSRP